MNPFDRNTNLIIINEIRNLEKTTINGYIERVLEPLNKINATFCEVLYKDITYLLEDLDSDGENELLIENGDFILEDGDLKLSGYRTRLHDIVIWLHIEAIKNIFTQGKLTQVNDTLDDFNRKLTDYKYTMEYKAELDKIKLSLRREKGHNYEFKHKDIDN